MVDETENSQSLLANSYYLKPCCCIKYKVYTSMIQSFNTVGLVKDVIYPFKPQPHKMVKHTQTIKNECV